MRTHCCRHVVADTLLPTQMFPRLPACATFVADKTFESGTQKMFLILFRNILCPQQMFPSLRSMETQHSFCVPRVCAPKKHHEQQCVRNNVSSFASTFKAQMLWSKTFAPQRESPPFQRIPFRNIHLLYDTPFEKGKTIFQGS